MLKQLREILVKEFFTLQTKQAKNILKKDMINDELSRVELNLKIKN